MSLGYGQPQERSAQPLNYRRLHWALESLPEINSQIGGRALAFFLDFDGTLAPLVASPEKAEMPAKTRELLASLAERHLVCIISGRGVKDLQRKTDLPTLYYAADHGHRIIGPSGSGIDLEVGAEYREQLRAAAVGLNHRLHRVEGVVVEEKGLSLSVHYRMVAEPEQHLVKQAVAAVAERLPALRVTRGKLVRELRPAGAWGKGQAMLWLLEQLAMGRNEVCPICLGDDLTDEDLFAASEGWGIGVLVGDPARPTRANYRLRNCDEVSTLLSAIGSQDDSTLPLARQGQGS